MSIGYSDEDGEDDVITKKNYIYVGIFVNMCYCKIKIYIEFVFIDSMLLVIHN